MDRASTYPLALQQKWILDRILETVRPNSTYTGDLIDKYFITYYPPHKKNTSKTPLARILQHIWVCSNGDLISVLGDSTNKVYAKFPYNSTIDRFERTHKQRITMGTKLSVILIKEARLKFIKAYQLHRETGIKTKKEFVEKFGVFRMPHLDVALLEIIDFEIFQRDQAQLSDQLLDSFKFVYFDKKYKDRCCMNKERTEADEDANATIADDYEDVVSI